MLGPATRIGSRAHRLTLSVLALDRAPGSAVARTASISPSPLEYHGRSSQMRTPLRRTRRIAKGCSGSVVCSHMNIGMTSCTTGGAGAAELGTLTATSLPADDSSSGLGSSSGRKNSRIPRRAVQSVVTRVRALVSGRSWIAVRIGHLRHAVADDLGLLLQVSNEYRSCCLDPVVHHDLRGAADDRAIGVGVVDDVVPVRP